MRRNAFLLGCVLVSSSLPGAKPAFGQSVREVNCDARETITAALLSVRSGDTLLVRGLCKEHINIPLEMARITLRGDGRAAISHPSGARNPGPSAHVVYIRGRGIALSGFRISGGVAGVHVSGPAHAIIHDNTISNNSGRGIHIDKGSIAQVFSNVVENNAGGGIHITESSMARIGFLIPPQPRLQPNQIVRNGTYGIYIERGSTARVVGNLIAHSTGPGVVVEGNSEADISANEIAGNAADGIIVSRNSGVSLSSEREGPTDGPNTTDPATQNRGFGVKCDIGSYVVGPLGSLTGRMGGKHVDASCTDRITDR
jgi:nitrous oxidase accessory protein NosD